MNILRLDSAGTPTSSATILDRKLSVRANARVAATGDIRAVLMHQH
ncbi:hypothetical protein [Nocardia xishanensis]